MKTTKELIIADITAKVEAKLASQKIELATITSIVKERGKIAEDYVRAQGIASASTDQLEAILKNVINKADTNLDYIEQAKKQVKDLGIENPKELIEAETSAKFYIKKTEEFLKLVVALGKF